MHRVFAAQFMAAASRLDGIDIADHVGDVDIVATSTRRSE
jgi:hypothetical protein